MSRAKLTALIGPWFGFGSAETRSDRVLFRLFEFIVVFWVALYAWTWASQIAALDQSVEATGLAQHIDLSFLRSNGRSWLIAGLISVFALAGIIRILRPAYTAALFLLHVQFSARFVTPPIDHSSHVIGLCLLGLAIAAIGFKSGPNRRKFALAFAWLSMGFGYLVSAATKLLVAGPRWADGTHLWMWINERATDIAARTGEFEPNVAQQVLLDNLWLATAVLTVGLVCHASGFFLWFRQTRHIQAAALLVVHAGIVMLLGTSPQPAMWLLALFAVPWERVNAAFASRP